MPDGDIFTSGKQLLLALLLLCSLPAGAGIIPGAEAWEQWRPASDEQLMEVDHSAWGTLLDTHLDASHPSGINRFDYRAVSPEHRALLESYLDDMSQVPVARLTRKQQQAFWINLYNALTVKLILDHPNADSIREIKDGWFSIGPWGREVIEVGGISLTLNDIEHRILRPLYEDARVHFAVNCASLGCPNLAPQPYTAANLESLYESGARAFINHSRGVDAGSRSLQLSSIFSWFKEDFGDDRSAVLLWLSQYAEPELAETLRSWKGPVRYDYDWRLNAP